MNTPQKLAIVGGIVLGAQLAVVTYQNYLVLKDLTDIKNVVEPVKDRLKQIGVPLK